LQQITAEKAQLQVLSVDPKVRAQKEKQAKAAGFQRANSGEASMGRDTVQLQPPGGPPAEAAADAEGLYAPAGSTSEEDRRLRSTIERYNLVAKFVDRNCDTSTQKRVCYLLISRLIPDLQSVSFADIDEMLNVVHDGMEKFNLN